AKATSLLSPAQVLESRFQVLDATRLLVRSLGATARLPAELADIALAVGDVRKNASHDWTGAFEAELVALEANPEVADSIMLLAVEWTRHRERPAEAVGPFVERAVAGAAAAS